MKKIFSIFLKIGISFFAIYSIVFLILVSLGGEENITISETNGKFKINVKIWAPYGYISDEKQTIISFVYLPMYNCWIHIEKQLTDYHIEKLEKTKQEIRNQKH